MKLILTVDNTGSMGQATSSAKASMEEIRTMTALLLGKPSVKMSAYGDYDGGTPDKEQGGWSILGEEAGAAERQAWLTKYCRPMGGGGAPEAQRTAFNHLLRERERSIVFHFTDAPPHDSARLDTEGRLEEAYLKRNQMETNWDRLCKDTKEKHRVVTFLTRSSPALVQLYSKMGEVVVVGRNTSTEITATMMAVLLQLIGQPSEKVVSFQFRNAQNGSIVNSQSTQVEAPIQLESILKTADPCMVIGAFDELLDPAKPNQAVCLTTNKILGRYWRLICGRYRVMDGGRFESRAQAVMDKLSVCKTKMDAGNQQILKKWIDESHDESAMIRGLVEAALPSCTSVLVLRGDPQISLDDLLALGRGGGNFVELSKLLATLEEVPKGDRTLPEDPDETPDFVPLQGMRLIHVFRLIANLIKPGIAFSPNTAMLAAILALPNKHLSGMAKEILEKRKGKWIDFSLDESGTPKNPTNFAINFVRILNLVQNNFLTEEEVQFRDHYLGIEKVIRNHDAIISVVTGSIMKEPRANTTWKRLCQGCGQSRCFTIFPGKSALCGICLTYNDPAAYSGPRERGITTADVVEAVPDKTHWAQCHGCKANYGITEIGALNVRPKCHYCRRGTQCPTVECHLCRHKYVSKDGAAETAMKTATSQADETTAEGQRLQDAQNKGAFVCPRCVVHPKSMVQDSEVKLADLLDENNKLRSLVPFEEYDALVNKSVKLWKRVLAVHPKNVDEVEWDPTTGMTFKGYTVHNPLQVAAIFKEKLLSNEATVPCCMCVGDTPLRFVVEACGHCTNRICQNCVDGWYGQVVPGAIVSQSNTACPFCKSTPKHAVIKNLAQAHIQNIRPNRKGDRELCEWDPRMWHATCTRCLMVKPAVGRECAGEAPPLQAFMCDECPVEQRRVDDAGAAVVGLRTQKCPGCGVQTEKNGGCNHITCSQCGEHWCWGCGVGGFTGHSVYGHMESCAGVFQDS